MISIRKEMIIMTAKSKTFEEIKEELTKTLEWINQITLKQLVL